MGRTTVSLAILTAIAGASSIAGLLISRPDNAARYSVPVSANARIAHKAARKISVVERASSNLTACGLKIGNGQPLEQNWGRFGVQHANLLRIDNRAAWPAIVKLRSSPFGHTQASVFVTAHSSATYNRIPDGRYEIEYALGDRLDAACISFIHIQIAAMLEAGVNFESETGSGRQESFTELTIAIPASPEEDATLQTIDIGAFNFE
jgi:hypothetical protein